MGIVSGKRGMQALCCVVDHASKGWHAIAWLNCGPPQLRGVFSFDRLHIVQNVMREARIDIGPTLLLMGCELAMNRPCWPFSKAGHLHTLRARVSELFRAYSDEEMPRQHLYRGVCGDLGLCGEDMGEQSHIQRVRSLPKSKDGGLQQRHHHLSGQVEKP